MSSREQTKTGGRPATTGVIPGLYALSVGKPDLALPEDWTWTALSDVARLETGHTPSRKHPEYWGGDVSWIGIKDATENHGRMIQDTYQHTNELGIENSSARILPKNTVCLSRTASVGYVVVMGKPMATSQDFVNWVCSDKIDYRFLKYVLLAEHETLLRFASGTTHQTIYFPEAKAFHVALPPRREQQAIADVLSALDDKIELNRRMNETLEAMARVLFKSWFIDFDPVRAKVEGRDLTLPAAISTVFPSSFAPGEVPQGWEVVPAYDLAEYINGAAYKAFEPNSEGRGLPIIKIAELKSGVTPQTGFSDVQMPEKYRIARGDVLFSWSGNPDTSIDTFVWAGGPAWLNQHIFKVVPKSEYERVFVLSLLKYLRPVFAEIARNKQTTGLGHVTVADLKRLTVVKPSGSVMRAWNAVAEPILGRVFNNEIQAATLAALRDTLLPKLISGEIRLKDAEKLVEAVA